MVKTASNHLDKPWIDTDIIFYKMRQEVEDAHSAKKGDQKRHFKLSYDYDLPRTVDFLCHPRSAYKKIVMKHLLGIS